ncbi:MAG: DUF4325 domain-containing protein, partial [Betaproteobacteria bacterium]
PLSEWSHLYKIESGLAEDVVWRNDVLPVLGILPDNVSNIWHFGFTEMFNNAIDHSEGKEIFVTIKKTAATTQMHISDDGVGIFKKIQNALGLLDPRHAVLELSKGKLTTDPTRHSGEGIFFTSRIFDSFDIMSDGAYFSHDFGRKEEWIDEVNKFHGTLVTMKLNNHTARTVRKIFDQFAAGDDLRFDKTIVPVRLTQYGNDQLISRSQAKRVVSRVDLFKIVVFDFTGVTSIGQAFADEIFRVFANQHPEIELHTFEANSDVQQMIDRVKTGTVIDEASVAQQTLPGIEPEPEQ